MYSIGVLYSNENIYSATEAGEGTESHLGREATFRGDDGQALAGVVEASEGRFDIRELAYQVLVVLLVK